MGEMILDGQTCQDCGVFMGMAVGYPRTCRGCKRMELHSKVGERAPNSGKTNCPVCNKRVKLVWLDNHLKDSHYTYWQEHNRVGGKK